MSELSKPVWVWLEGQTRPMRAGQFSLDTPTGPIGRFHYDYDYLQHPGAFALDPLSLPLPRRTSLPYTTVLNGGLFGVFRDVSPEGYGRDLLNHHFRRTDDNRLSSMELLEHSGGDGVGAIEVCDDIERKLSYRVPTASALTDLLAQLDPTRAASHAVHQLLELGTSMGGERPKLTVTMDGDLWLAKLQDRGDTPHVPAREFATMQIARECGINSAHVQLQRMPNGHEVLLVRRFDRPGQDGRRLPYLSAHTALRLDSGSLAGDRPRSYLVLADTVRRMQLPEADIIELWRRMVFNSLVNNIDDHPRNHGFIRREGGWRLAPAFDIVPMLGESNVEGPILAMAVTADNSSHAAMSALLESAGHFGLDPFAAGDWLIATATIIADTWASRMTGAGLDSKFMQRQGNSFDYAKAIAEKPMAVRTEAQRLAAMPKKKRRASSTRHNHWLAKKKSAST